MKEAITKFDLEAAFKALDEIDTPKAEKGIKANRPALTEIFSRKSKFDALFEEYYDISSTEGLDDAKEARDAEIAKAKLARIEKIVDLDADSPEDLLTSYVGKYIMQCPQCMTLFYKNKEDVVESEEDPSTVNVSEICQHCGNESGYTLIGKVGEASSEEVPTEETEITADELSMEELTDEENQEETSEDTGEEDFDLDSELDELDLEIEDDEANEEKKEESFSTDHESNYLLEQLTEETDLDVSADEFEELINTSEFKKPISDTAVRTMLASEADEEKELEENININSETLKYAVINPDGTYAGVPCTSEEEARELAAQKEGRIIAELVELKKNSLTNEDLKENIFGSIFKTRAGKADWVLKQAREDYNNIQVDKKGEPIPDKNKQRFNTFVVIGYKDRYDHGALITKAPPFNSPDLEVGMDKAMVASNYKSADNIAKGWSMQQGNGPACIYLAKSADDDNAVFLCEYFKGKLEYDQLDKYTKAVKDHLKGAKLMAKGGAGAQPTNNNSTEETETATESLNIFMDQVEELEEGCLEKLIADSLVEAYGNVAGFRLKSCDYLNEYLCVNGTIFFTSGNMRKTTYTFTDAFKKDSKINLYGLNEKLGKDKQFNITGHIDNKTFITESFKYTKK